MAAGDGRSLLKGAVSSMPSVRNRIKTAGIVYHYLPRTYVEQTRAYARYFKAIKHTPVGGSGAQHVSDMTFG
jgi:hypothetical protein